MKDDRSCNNILEDVWVRLTPLQKVSLAIEMFPMKQESRRKYLLKVEQDLNNSTKKDIYFIITLYAVVMLSVLSCSLINYLK